MDFSFKTKEFVEEFEKKCSKLQKKSFNKNEIITTYINKRNQICILIDGEADLVRYDYNGNKTIVEHFTKNDIFGEVFYVISTNNELFVKARKKCEVLFFSYKNLKQKCKSNCKFHQILNENISELILNKVILLNTRIELLAKRSIREKLLGYFNVLSTVPSVINSTSILSFPSIGKYILLFVGLIDRISLISIFLFMFSFIILSSLFRYIL